MTTPRIVAVVAPYGSIVIDYRTGRVQLRSTATAAPKLPSGSVVVHHPGTALSWGTNEVPTVLAPLPEVPLRWYLGAVPAVMVTALAAAVGPRRGRFARMIRLASYGRALPPADRTQAEHAVRAVRRMSSVIPARWACLEQSTAASLLLSAAGRRAEWRHGVAADPWRLHAWIADRAGQPVDEPADTALCTPTYTPDGPVPGH